MDITPETRLVDITVGQLMELFAQQVKKATTEQDTPDKPLHLVYGIAGIAHIFNCSLTTANRIKASGRIDGAITQHGRVIVVDADKALLLFNQTKQ